MDIEILQQTKRLFALFTEKQQSGSLIISMQQITWTTTSGEEINLQPILQPPLVANQSEVLPNKARKRLKTCFELGKRMQNEPNENFLQYSVAIKRTAQRVYEFYSFVGEDQMGTNRQITPSLLYKLSTSKFEDLKFTTLAETMTFGGPQAEEGDDLLPF
jgi:hypothetical protein